MALVVLIPGPLGRRLSRLRDRFDPEADRELAAHVPLLGPFQARPSFLPLEQHCWRACHETAPFSVELGELAFDEGGGLLYFEVASGSNELRALREALLEGKYAPHREDAAYEPRAVVGRLARRDDLVLGDCEEAATRSGRSFYLERIELMAQYPDGAWYERDFYTLDRAATRA